MISWLSLVITGLRLAGENGCPAVGDLLRAILIGPAAIKI
jgi:hypothetical protein